MAMVTNIEVHEVIFGVGKTYSGIAPATDLANNTVYKASGRVVYFKVQNDAGKIGPVPDVGLTIHRVTFNGAGTTSAKLILVDHDGIEYEMWDETTIPENFTMESVIGWQAPPGFHFKFVTAGDLTSNGRAVFYKEPAWQPALYQNMPV